MSPSRASFNSRPHTEVDITRGKKAKTTILSIHDLTRRSTCDRQYQRKIVIFQFTTSHGGRRDLLNGGINAGVFQFTTSHGGRRRVGYCFSRVSALSIHDLTRRSTLKTDQSNQYRSSFNSRPHTEVDKRVEDWKGVDGLSIHDLTRRSTEMKT